MEPDFQFNRKQWTQLSNEGNNQSFIYRILSRNVVRNDIETGGSTDCECDNYPEFKGLFNGALVAVNFLFIAILVQIKKTAENGNLLES